MKRSQACKGTPAPPAIQAETDQPRRGRLVISTGENSEAGEPAAPARSLAPAADRGHLAARAVGPAGATGALLRGRARTAAPASPPRPGSDGGPGRAALRRALWLAQQRGTAGPAEDRRPVKRCSGVRPRTGTAETSVRSGEFCIDNSVLPRTCQVRDTNDRVQRGASKPEQKDEIPSVV